MGYAANDPELRLMNTDMYQATMSQAWFDTLADAQDEFQHKMHQEQSAYYLHWRTPPLGSKYTCVAGLEEAVDFLNNFGFNTREIAYLRTLKDGDRRVFTDEFVDYLRDMKLELDIDAIPEGEVMTCEGPVIRVKGPRVQGQLVESLLLQIMNSNSIIATRASLLGTATENESIINMSLRRAASKSAAVSRSAHIGGCASTASMLHAMDLGIPAAGTMAHAFIMSFQKDGVANDVTELRAFECYMKSMPGRTTLLVDTYSTEQGIRNAIQAAINTDIPLKGIRLDSGDLYADAWMAREMLDAAAKENPHLFKNTNIIATDGLSEKTIAEFKKRSLEEKGEKFPVTVWGVGTNLGNPGPFNGGVYKICARLADAAKSLWQGCMKIAGVNKEDANLPSSKASIPAVDMDVLRLWKDGKIVADIIVDTAMDVKGLFDGKKAILLKDNKTELDLPEFDNVTTLLVPVFKKGQNVFEQPAQKEIFDGTKVTDLDKIRNFHLAQKAALSENHVVLIDPRIQADRIAMIAKTNAEKTPHEIAGGEVQQKNREIA